MKKIYTLIFFLSITASLKAQVLNSNEMMPYNTQCNFLHPDGFSIIDTNIQGSNKTWNFQAITPDNSLGTFQVTILDPAATPYGANYTGSNYCMKEMPGSTYNYFNKTASALERLGSQDSVDQSHYTDTQKELVFPMQLGVTSTDTWVSSSSGTYTLECIGSGTLILPNATYSSVLFVRGFMGTGFLDFYAYYWYNADNGAVLLNYIPGDGFWIPEAAVYLVSMTIGIDEKPVPFTLQYNNPVQNNLHVDLTSRVSGDMEYVVVNSLGAIVKTETIDVFAQEPRRISIDCSNLSDGIYFVRFGLTNEAGAGIKSIKVIKQ